MRARLLPDPRQLTRGASLLAWFALELPTPAGSHPVAAGLSERLAAGAEGTFLDRLGPDHLGLDSMWLVVRFDSGRVASAEVVSDQLTTLPGRKQTEREPGRPPIPISDSSLAREPVEETVVSSASPRGQSRLQ